MESPLRIYPKTKCDCAISFSQKDSENAEERDTKSGEKIEEVCMKKPNRISLKEFAKDFTAEQKRIVQEETKYYYLLTAFRDAREKKGLSQEELAKKANINRTTLSQVESGLRNATIGTLDRLATAMDMRLDVRLRIS